MGECRKTSVCSGRSQSSEVPVVLNYTPSQLDDSKHFSQDNRSWNLNRGSRTNSYEINQKTRNVKLSKKIRVGRLHLSFLRKQIILIIVHKIG